MLIDSLMICNNCIKVDDDVMIKEDVEKVLKVSIKRVNMNVI